MTLSSTNNRGILCPYWSCFSEGEKYKNKIGHHEISVNARTRFNFSLKIYGAQHKKEEEKKKI